MLTGELKFVLARGRLNKYSADGELVYYVDELGSAEVLVRIDSLDFDGKSFITEIDWKLSLSGFDADSASEVSKVPDLEYRWDLEEVRHAEDRPYYLLKRTFEKRIIDSESEKRELIKLIKQAPFIFLKEGGEKWLEKFSSVLAKGRTMNKYSDYLLHEGSDKLELHFDHAYITVSKFIIDNKGDKKEHVILDKEDRQKAKELIELFEKVLSGQVDLQDAISEALKSLGLSQDFSRRRR